MANKDSKIGQWMNQIISELPVNQPKFTNYFPMVKKPIGIEEYSISSMNGKSFLVKGDKKIPITEKQAKLLNKI